MTDPRLTPDTVDFMEKSATLNMPAFGECSAEELRAATNRRGKVMPPAIEPVRKVIRRKFNGPVGEVPLRIYIPDNAEPPYPVIMVFHGGGWTIRSFELEGPTSRGLANRVGAIAISVQYRLAPEPLMIATPPPSGQLKTLRSSTATLRSLPSPELPPAGIYQPRFRSWHAIATARRFRIRSCTARLSITISRAHLTMSSPTATDSPNLGCSGFGKIT